MPRILQATPSGYIVELEDGNKVLMPEHVVVQAGLVQPSAGAQHAPVGPPPSVTEFSPNGSTNKQVYPPGAAPWQPGGSTEVSVPDAGYADAIRGGANRRPTHVGPSRVPTATGPAYGPYDSSSARTPAENDFANGVREGGGRKPTTNIPVQMNVADDFAREDRRNQSIARLRAMLGLA